MRYFALTTIPLGAVSVMKSASIAFPVLALYLPTVPLPFDTKSMLLETARFVRSTGSLLMNLA